MENDAPSVILTLDRITKTYGGTRALDRASFDLRQGEVHSICGENGAGKSTLIKVLSGAVQPDDGLISIGGVEFSQLSPAEALEKGIATIYQENALFQGLSVAENMFVGALLKTSNNIVDLPRMQRKAAEILAKLGSDINPKAILGTLGGAQQKIVEIARAFRQNASILVMDEPSSSFGHHEVDLLFRAVREVTTSGTAVVFISHHLEEVFELSDRVTILRDGKMVATYAVGDINETNLINQMVGRDVTQVFHHEPSFGEEIALNATSIRGPGVRDASITLNRGEVVGIAGLVGSGRSELLNLIFGSLVREAGHIEVFGRPVEISSPAAAVNLGLCLITEDRKIDGLLLGQSFRDNFLLPSFSRYARPLMRWKAVTDDCNSYVNRLSIKIQSIFDAVDTMSGGNQQKAILAKWMNTDPDIYLFDEPTRGIDIGAKEEIYLEIQTLIKAGKSVLLVSSELPEVIGLSDRIYVMKDGRISDEFSSSDATQHKILEAAL